MNPLSLDLRTRIVAAYKETSASYAEVATAMRVGSATVKRLVRLERTTGSVAPREYRRGPAPTILSNHYEELRVLLDEQPDLTYDELAVRWSIAIGFVVSRSATVRRVKRLGYTLKKSRS